MCQRAGKTLLFNPGSATDRRSEPQHSVGFLTVAGGRLRRDHPLLTELRRGTMKIFAIGDLHLPGRQDKPMDVFGGRLDRSWRSASLSSLAGEGRPRRRRAHARRPLVGDDSREAADDLAYLGSLPGRSDLIRGNHDYWWSAIGKVRKALPPGRARDSKRLRPRWVSSRFAGRAAGVCRGPRVLVAARRKGVPARSGAPAPFAGGGRQGGAEAGHCDDALPAGAPQRKRRPGLPSCWKRTASSFASMATCTEKRKTGRSRAPCEASITAWWPATQLALLLCGWLK